MERILKLIPNTLTSMNLLMGCLAIVSAISGDLIMTFWFVIMGAIFDFLDGFAARLLKAYSPLGVQLDSLADMVTFGVAPSMVLYNMGAGYIAFIIAIFSALRLAKFNIDTRQTETFMGLPTPANAIFFISLGYIYQTTESEFVNELLLNNWFQYGVVVIFSLLMVSEIPMFSLKIKGFDLNKYLIVYLFIIVTIALIVIFGICSLPFIITLYILVSCIKYIFNLNKK